MFSLKNASTKTCKPWPRLPTFGEYFATFLSGGSSALDEGVWLVDTGTGGDRRLP